MPLQDSTAAAESPKLLPPADPGRIRRVSEQSDTGSQSGDVLLISEKPPFSLTKEQALVGESSVQADPAKVEMVAGDDSVAATTSLSRLVQGAATIDQYSIANKDDGTFPVTKSGATAEHSQGGNLTEDNTTGWSWTNRPDSNKLLSPAFLLLWGPLL